MTRAVLTPVDAERRTVKSNNNPVYGTHYLGSGSVWTGVEPGRWHTKVWARPGLIVTCDGVLRELHNGYYSEERVMPAIWHKDIEPWPAVGDTLKGGFHGARNQIPGWQEREWAQGWLDGNAGVFGDEPEPASAYQWLCIEIIGTGWHSGLRSSGRVRFDEGRVMAEGTFAEMFTYLQANY